MNEIHIFLTNFEAYLVVATTLLKIMQLIKVSSTERPGSTFRIALSLSLDLQTKRMAYLLPQRYNI